MNPQWVYNGESLIDLSSGKQIRVKVSGHVVADKYAISSWLYLASGGYRIRLGKIFDTKEKAEQDLRLLAKLLNALDPYGLLKDKEEGQ